MTASLLWAILLWSIATGSLCARLGEPVEDCVLRYGEKVGSAPKIVGESDGDAVLFQKAGIDIHAEFKGGKVWLIRFTKRNMTNAERDHLLEANGAGSDWLGPVAFYGREHWISRSGNHHAVERTMGRSTKVLEIMNDVCLKARDRQREERLREAISSGRGASRSDQSSPERAERSSSPPSPVEALEDF